MRGGLNLKSHVKEIVWSSIPTKPCLKYSSHLFTKEMKTGFVFLALACATVEALGDVGSEQQEMTWQSWLCLWTIVAVVAALLFEVAPVTSVMFTSTLFLMMTTITDSSDFILGLNQTSILAIAQLFIVVQPLSRLPLLKKTVHFALDGGSTANCMGMWWPMLKICALAMVLSAFANQNPMIVLLTPLVKQYCRDNGYAASRFLMPMAYASALGGSWTVVGTSVNLTYNALMNQYGYAPMKFFELIKTTGIPSLVGLLYLLVAQSFLLPKQKGGMFKLMRERNNSFMAQFVIQKTSPLAGKQVADVDKLVPKAMLRDAAIIEIVRTDGSVIAPPRDTDTFQAGDLLVFTGDVTALRNCAKLCDLTWVPNSGSNHEDVEATNSAPDSAPQIGDSERKPIGKVESCRNVGSSDPYEVAAEDPHQPIGRMRAASMKDLTTPVAHELTTGRSRATSVKTPINDHNPDSATVVITDLENVSFASAAIRHLQPTQESPDFIEVVLAYRCVALGATVGSGAFQRYYGVSILAVRKASGQEDFTSESRMNEQVLHVGDTLLVFGPPSFADKFDQDFSLISFASSAEDDPMLVDHYVFVPSWFCCGREVGDTQMVKSNDGDHPPKDAHANKAILIPHWYPYLSVVIFLAMIVITAIGNDIFMTSAIAVVLMVSLKLMTLREALQAIDLNVILSIAYSFGLGQAMSKSGLASVVGNAIANANISGFKLLLLISAVASVITNAITNKACAQVLYPVVVSIYQKQNHDPLAATMVLAAVSSWAFCTPYGKPTNLIIMGPGGYRPMDYLKYGLILNALIVVLIPVAAATVYDEWTW